MRQFLFLFVAMIALSGCQLGRGKFNSVTPYIPFFAAVRPGEVSKSNPYFNRYTVAGSQEQMTLDNGATYLAPSPLITGTLGTHYRFRQDIYAYVMTEGFGAQYDLKFWEHSKLAATGWVGYGGGVGLLIGASYKAASLWGADVTPYFTVQRRKAERRLGCTSECIPASPIPGNRLTAHQDIFESMIGVEYGRFKFGEVGNTTVAFQLEAGLQRVLSSRLVSEDHPSHYNFTQSAFFASFYADFTLW